MTSDSGMSTTAVSPYPTGVTWVDRNIETEVIDATKMTLLLNAWDSKGYDAAHIVPHGPRKYLVVFKRRGNLMDS